MGSGLVWMIHYMVSKLQAATHQTIICLDFAVYSVRPMYKSVCTSFVNRLQPPGGKTPAPYTAPKNTAAQLGTEQSQYTTAPGSSLYSIHRTETPGGKSPVLYSSVPCVIKQCGEQRRESDIWGQLVAASASSSSSSSSASWSSSSSQPSSRQTLQYSNWWWWTLGSS